LLRTISTAGALAGTLILPLLAASTAQAATHYTHSTTLKQDCAIHHNFPKSGVPDRTWPKAKKSANGAPTHVGVRYTYKGYAMVLDYAKKTDPSWGFIAQSCLSDPHAYSGGDHGSPIGDLRAIGGNGKVEAVAISAPHSGRSQHGTIHLGSNGSVRDAARSFVIGNASKGDTFRITTAHCGHHSASSWILGYAPATGRWGYIEAMHLPACR
jgi:hypothetical protein